MKISKKDLQYLIKRINDRLEKPEDYYHLSGAYGGWKLVRERESGGIEDVTKSGFTSKKELYYEMLAFLAGVETMIEDYLENPWGYYSFNGTN